MSDLARKTRSFLADEDGAITVDWVALTAGILLVAIMVVYAIYNNGVSTLVSEINTNAETRFTADIGTVESINQ